jgi:predicted DNA binding CopG/RHH family protein
VSREKRFNIRLTEYEFAKLKAEAERQGVTMAEIMRDYIRRLPEPEQEKQS